MWRERDRVQSVHLPAANRDEGSRSGSGEDALLPTHPLLAAGTDISGCSLDCCDFSCCSIMQFNFGGVSLQRCSFQGAVLSMVVLSGCSVIGCDFSGARCFCDPFGYVANCFRL
jgi:uncharacterized protein YjbI with pentapeptide repeats